MTPRDVDHLLSRIEEVAEQHDHEEAARLERLLWQHVLEHVAEVGSGGAALAALALQSTNVAFRRGG